MGCFIDTKQKKLLDISVSLAQLLLQMENDWDDHLLKAAHFHSSTSSGMRKELILVYVRRHFVLYMDSLKSDCKCFVKRSPMEILLIGVESIKTEKKLVTVFLLWLESISALCQHVRVTTPEKKMLDGSIYLLNFP